MEGSIATVILTIDRNFELLNQIFGELNMTLLTSNMKTVGTLLVRGTHKDWNILKIVMKPSDNFNVPTIASIVERSSDEEDENGEINKSEERGTSFQNLWWLVLIRRRKEFE